MMPASRASLASLGGKMFPAQTIVCMQLTSAKANPPAPKVPRRCGGIA